MKTQAIAMTNTQILMMTPWEIPRKKLKVDAHVEVAFTKTNEAF